MKKITKVIPYFIITLITIGIFLITLKINNFYPFGNYDIAKYDAYYQYKPMLYNFITSIKNGNLLSFSFLNGLGNPTIFNYLYYLASPLNLVAILFKTPEAMYFSVIFIKTIITSLLSLFYFKKRTNNSFISIVCSLSYTFSSWYLSYHIHIMWLDAFMIFPLLQYGLEELMNHSKYNIYILALAYTMLTNFYMAFMICLYIFIYYMYNIIIKKDKYINKIKNFQLIMVSTIITCLLAAFTIYATYSSFLKMGINITDNSSIIARMNITDLIKSLLIGGSSSNIHQFIENIPNIGVSLLFLISLFYYFINDKIKVKEKITTLIAIVFTIFILFSNKMNFIINCFHTPSGYTFRYSFIITFYIFIIFIRNYKTFNNKIDTKVYISSLTILILIVIEFLLKNIEFNIFITNLVFILSYTIILLFYDKNKYNKFLFLIIIISELIVNYTITLYNNEKYELDSLEQSYSLSKEYRQKINNNYLFAESINKNLYDNTNVIESFSSMQYNSIINLLDELGCATDMKATIFSCNNTSVFDMVFNVQGKYNLPKVFAVKKDIFLYDIETDNSLENQNNLVLGISDIKSIIKSRSLESKENMYKYVVPNSQEYIIQISPLMKYIRVNEKVYINDLKDLPQEYLNLNINTDLFRKRLIVETLNQGDQIEVVFKNESESNLDIYYIDEDLENKLYNFLSQNAIKYEKYKENYIEGKINVSDNEVIFTSIPYDTSWEIEIDGIKKEPIKIYDSLMGVECSPGEHKITLQYKNDFKIPIIISISTFFMLVFNIIMQCKKRN